MADLFDPIEPHMEVMLDVGDGHVIWVGQFGNPTGEPVLIAHGGPGSGSSATARRYFDPDRFRIIQFDQRGCGRSTPHAGDTIHALAHNTTHNLIEDIESIRTHLDIERWMLFGGSWGSTLALAYALAERSRVTRLVLHAIALTRRADVDWVTDGIQMFHPRAWEVLRRHLDVSRGERIVDAYADALSDPEKAGAAAQTWVRYEQAIADIQGHACDRRWSDDRFVVGFSRLVTHYWRHSAWMDDDHILRNAAAMGDVPLSLIHGQLDLTAPLGPVYALHRAWPGSVLEVIQTAGHDRRDQGMAAAIIRAIHA
ncbi:MAG: prolyl aminopeptidase [Pseudomonadota bacterium]